jgi:hypothetical protein
MQTQNRRNVRDSFCALAAAVISRTLADLEKDSKVIRSGPYIRDEAMSWVNSPECEAFCYMTDVDCRAVREKAADLYRHFLERAESREKAPGKPRRSQT